jgi:Asp-tRNA(Asn)/Glu-tRNA(Gln) amidotransferase A subunit family amidase
MVPELTDLSIAQAAVRIQARTLSPIELTEACLQRIGRLNPTINAYITVTAGLDGLQIREQRVDMEIR